MTKIIGFTAGLLVSLCLIPQLIKVITIKSAKDLSWAWLWLYLMGMSLWFTYGLLMKDLPLILTNAFSCNAIGLIMILKHLYERRTY